VEALADDDQDPTFAVLLTLSNEAEHFALGFTGGLPVQIALCLDLERWIFEGAEDARMCGAAFAENDPVALSLHLEQLGWSQRWLSRARGSTRLVFRRRHHALSRRSVQGLHVGKRLFEGFTVGFRAPASSTLAASTFAAFAT